MRSKLAGDRILLTVVLCAAFCIEGCRFARNAELPGLYVAQDEWGSATLRLTSDGRFVETARGKGFQNRTLEGNWSFDGRRVHLRPCMQITSEGVGDENYGACDYSVTVYGMGHVEISLDPDAGLAYRK